MTRRKKEFHFGTSLKWTNDQQGVASCTGKPNVEVACPPVFNPKSPEDAWTPEDLLVSAVEVCLLMTFVSRARRRGIEFKSYTSRADGTLEFVDDCMMFTKIEIEVDIEVPKGQDKDLVVETLLTSEDRCFVTRSMKVGATIKPNIVYTRD